MQNTERDDVFTENENLSESDKDTAFVKCSSCGSNMVFDPQTQNLKCEHCGRVENFAKNSDVEEISIERAFDAAESWSGEATTYRCDNCGATFDVEADEVSVLCPYCSTTHVVKEENLTGIKPNAVYPFILTKASAILASRKWARRRIFAPRKFKKNLTESNLHGVYQPCFTFDSATHTFYSGVLGEHRTRTVRTSDGKTRTETYIHWKPVSGIVDKFYDDVTISCGKMSQGELDKIAPTDKSTLCVYERRFLSGFTAGHYTRHVKDCWSDAKRVIDGDLRQVILRKHGCDVIQTLNLSTNHSSVTYKYLLVPVYRLNYKYNKKQYPVLVNGNNGRVTGKAPVSPIRVAIAAVLGMALIFGIIYLCSMAEGSDYSSIYQAVEGFVDNTKLLN